MDKLESMEYGSPKSSFDTFLIGESKHRTCSRPRMLAFTL